MIEYMNAAIKEAQKALRKKEIPVGCVIVHNKKIISKSHNNRQKKYSILGHAEIIAILKAEKKIKDWRLNECEMYVTLYPCNMCHTFIKEARIEKVYYLLDSNLVNNYDNYIKITEENKSINEYKSNFKKYFSELRK